MASVCSLPAPVRASASASPKPSRRAARGARVAIAGRREAALQNAAGILRGLGGEILVLPMDVADRASVNSAAARMAEMFGGIDILCANAGIYPTHSLDEMTGADWDEVMNINARGTLFCVQACLPYLRQAAAGRIVLTSSITGPVTGISGLTHYGASKAAQLGFMRSAALELAKDKITVNAVLPGVIETDMLTSLGQEFLDNSIALVPVKRLGTPADIAHAVMFFAAAASAFVTGQTLIVDGGQTLPEAPGV